MTDKDEPVTMEPTEEPKAAEPTEEPKAEEPAEEPSDTAVPADDTAMPAGTDQLGRQLYNVKCADCGKQTQVPFKPSGDRPVYCRDCYMKRRGTGPGGGMGREPRR